ncbi:MAG: glycoside hydrolase family 130 protein [Phycisphaeraceae bacterium]
MSMIRIRRHDLTVLPESARVILRPFIPSGRDRITAILGRTLALTDEEVAAHLASVLLEFDGRHLDIEGKLHQHFDRIVPYLFTHRPLSRELRLLIGAMFSGEYALESAAIFNPSIVRHPDQSGTAPGEQRFIMSLRATGEGHISSIEFRAGSITADGSISLDDVSRFVSAPKLVLDPRYDKTRFWRRLHEMGLDEPHMEAVLGPLAESFTRRDLTNSVEAMRREIGRVTPELTLTLDHVQWLADSNYELEFAPELAMSERIIFPVSPNETNGIEDARFVRFQDDDGSVVYYATYTAYNGQTILPQLIRTEDFCHFRMLTLGGSAIQNKGMALFPRRIDGRFAMLSRQDDENIHLMMSDNPHQWSDPRVILRPSETWESIKIGNCGSPLETEAGWLVITHGVGPMRKYCIGAALLDLHDPTKVIGRLSTPLITPVGTEREGYVPNVVYSCGSIIHNRELIVPFAVSDRSSMIASVSLDHLLDHLVGSSGK